jgi:predicted membrane channel-forming protein YqfA (hemolysin III family)
LAAGSRREAALAGKAAAGMSPDPEQSHGEELANSISHALALVAALVGVPILLVHAARLGSAPYIVGAAVFSATIILLYLASAISCCRWAGPSASAGCSTTPRSIC